MRQIEVARDVADQLRAGSRCIFGVMVESHLVAGAQKFSAGKDDPARLAHGQSITDACLGWDDSVGVLQTLSDAVEARRR
jgi:3-deoxy-7-phosphoheptulonate synthase